MMSRALVRVSLFVFAMLPCASMAAQEDGGIGYDYRGSQVLESIYVPTLPNAPFSMTLTAEWTRPLLTGGSFTVANARPIKRDSAGRIYQERWLMAPKGTNIRSTMSWIQIEDPVAGLYYECNPHSKICEMQTYHPDPMPSGPSKVVSGPLPGGKGYRQHEDLGSETAAGQPVHAYRDTVTIIAGVMGNDKEMTYRREIRYAPQLGFNLASVLESPAVGVQRFAVTEIVTTEPEQRWFKPPEGYRVVEKRKTLTPVQ